MTTAGTRVLFLDCAPFHGGAQRSLLSLVEALASEGVDPLVVTADMTADGVLAECQRRGLASHGIICRHWSRTPAGLLRFLVDRVRTGRVLRQLVNDWRPDLIHANTVRAALLVPGRIAAAVPLVVHDRDARMPRLARQLVARRCQRILAISRSVGDLWTMARPGQTRVVPNGIWVESIARTVPDATSQGRVAMVADFEQWKRHDLFVQAMGRVCARQQDAKALLVGRCRPGCEAWLATVRREIVSLGMQDCCEVRTDVENAWPCIAGARMLVSCATGEPFGRTVVEALAMERPVVAVRGGGPDEILQDCAAGVLVDGRAEEIADAICAAWDWGDDPARRTAARDRAQRFTVDRMAGQVLETYRELAPRWVG